MSPSYIIPQKGATRTKKPIGPFPTDDGFVITLPYGTTPDWLKNVMTAGSAVIVHEGDTIPVVDPEVILSDIAFPYAPQSEQWSLRAFDVNQFLRVRRVEHEETAGETEPLA